MRRKAFKQRELFQDVLCYLDYAERVVKFFSNKIQSKLYGGNRSVSIEGIASEHFTTVPQTNINSNTPSHQHHTMFHSFLSADSKQDANTTPAHSKGFIHFSNTKKYQQYH